MVCGQNQSFGKQKWTVYNFDRLKRTSCNYSVFCDVVVAAVPKLSHRKTSKLRVNYRIIYTT
jgi:hypothetical protein